MNEPITTEKPQSSTQIVSTETIRPGQSPLLLLVRVLLVVSLFGCIALLLFDFFPTVLAFLTHGPVSALPLLLVGLAYLFLQFLVRPRPIELLKRVMLASAFILWGIDHLLPSGPAATTLGDIVIVLYIVDLALMMRDALLARKSGV